MSRPYRRRGSLVVGIVWIVGIGCGSSTPPLAPIPDPGGPFQTTVPSDASLGALTSEQYLELCNELAAAPYLDPGLVRELTCRQGGLEAAWNLPIGGSQDGGADGGIRDGGADGGSFLSVCQAAYDNCQQILLPSSVCPLPSLSYSGCTAAVELLSACVNELANTDPVATCLSAPSCATAAATGSAGNIPTGPCPSGPSPACTRLAEQCPGSVQGLFPSPH
jgi:hypothetical protein